MGLKKNHNYYIKITTFDFLRQGSFLFTVLSFFGVCRCLHVSERGTGQFLEKDLELGVIFVVSLILALIEKV